MTDRAPSPLRRRLPVLGITMIVAGLAAMLMGGTTIVRAVTRDDPPPAPTVSPSAPAEAGAFACWTGEPADDVAECEMPDGRGGAEWVFPSVEDGSGCRNTLRMGDAEGRTSQWRCLYVLPGGTRIKMHYSRWTGNRAARSAYKAEDTYGRRTVDDGTTQWFIDSDGRFKAALVYATAPWSVTVYAPNAKARDKALEQLLRMRPESELRGVRR